MTRRNSQLLLAATIGIAIVIVAGCKLPRSSRGSTERTYTARVIPRVLRGGKMVGFSLKIVDDLGDSRNYLRRPDGSLPAAPLIRVVDSDGNEVHSARMGYG
jgi:hypothetical protein